MKTAGIVLLGLLFVASPGCGAAGTPLVTFPPELDSVSPNIGGVGGGTLLTLTGRNFAALATVTVGGLPCVSVTVDPFGMSLTCVTPPGTLGLKDVTISTVTGSDTLPGSFTYAVPAKPLALSVEFVMEGAGGLLIALWPDLLFQDPSDPSEALCHREVAPWPVDDLVETGGYVFALDATLGALLWYVDLAAALLGEMPLGCVLDERLQGATGFVVHVR